MFRDFQPTIIYKISGGTQPHFAFDNFSKQTQPLMRTDSDKVRAVLRVIIGLKSNGSTVMDVGIKCHNSIQCSAVLAAYNAGKACLALRNREKSYDDTAGSANQKVL